MTTLVTGATGHLLACQRGLVGERYILGGQNLTLSEMLTLIARLVDGGRRRFACLPAWFCHSPI